MGGAGREGGGRDGSQGHPHQLHVSAHALPDDAGAREVNCLNETKNSAWQLLLFLQHHEIQDSFLKLASLSHSPHGLRSATALMAGRVTWFDCSTRTRRSS